MHGAPGGRGARKDISLGSPPLRLSCRHHQFADYVLRLGSRNPSENIIHGFLDARVRPMKPARCLGCKLAEHITILQGV